MDPEYFRDKRDSIRYEIVHIGNQTWFAQNLAFDTTNSWAYNDNTDYVQRKGRLYPFKVAVTACPCGWHLPSDEEWKTLEIELGMTEKLDKEGWRGNGVGQARLLKKGGGSGFNAEFSGYRNARGGYTKIGGAVYYWTSSKYIPNDKHAWIRYIIGRASILRTKKHKDTGYSVRCIKDEKE